VNSPTAAERRASELLEDAAIDSLPVPVVELAISLGVDLRYESYEGEVSGMLYRRDDGAVIGVNSMHAPTRQRFTIAHEIGHFLLHKGRPLFIDRFVRVNWRNGQSDREEVQANAFAAELLMPRKLVGREVDRVLSKRRTVAAHELAAELARIFDVSPEAMQYRLANLGVLDPFPLIS
jgi:Zn-dependent peptidase ImmA (M78 family)